MDGTKQNSWLIAKCMDYGDGKGSGFILTSTVDTVDATSLFLFFAYYDVLRNGVVMHISNTGNRNQEEATEQRIKNVKMKNEESNHSIGYGIYCKVS